MADIRNDLAPDGGSRERLSGIDQGNLGSGQVLDAQMQELMVTLLQRRQMPVVAGAGAISMVQELRSEIADVINQVKAALAEPQAMGFLSRGTAGFSIESFVATIKDAAATFEARTTSSLLDPIERQLSFMVFSVLDPFLLTFLDIDIADLNRRDATMLLPPLLETRQALMELELKASLGMFAPQAPA